MIKIIRDTDALTREEFTFWFDERRMVLYLDAYYFKKRQTKRHNFKVVTQYSRSDSRRPPYNWMELKDVPLTEDIKNRALEQFISEIKVGVWNDRE